MLVLRRWRAACWRQHRCALPTCTINPWSQKKGKPELEEQGVDAGWGQTARMCSRSRRGVRLKVFEKEKAEVWRKIAPIKLVGRPDAPRTMETLVHTLCYLAMNGDDYRGYDVLDEGADPNQFDKLGWTALLYAADRGHSKFVELLLERGADVNKCDEDGFTPLMQAADRNNAAVVKELVMRGADLNKTNNAQRAALHFAAHAGNHRTLTLLVDGGANLEIQDKDEWTPLHYAAHGGYTDMARLLIAAGANVHAKTKLNETPLHLAAVTGTWQTTQVLLANGADPNAKAEDLNTALHCAVWWGHEIVADFLLRHHGDLTEENKDGETPLAMAKRLGYARVVKTLESRPARRLRRSTVDGTAVSGEEDEDDDEVLRPNRLETTTIYVKKRKFVTAARTMACIQGSYFWLMLNPRGDIGPAMFREEQELELGPGPGDELKEIGKREFVLDRNPVNFEFVLDYVRQARYSRHRDVKLPDDKYLLADLLREARFYRVPELVQTILDKRTHMQRKSYRHVIPERRRRRMVQSGSLEPQPQDMGKWYIPRFRKRRQAPNADLAWDDY